MKQPKLLSNQFAVLMVDGATGIVLTTSGKIYMNDNKKVYMIFDDLDAARIFIKSKQDKNDTLELCVYNFSFEFVECWDAPKWRK